MVLVEVSECGLFRDVLPDQFVGIFIQASFPGRIGMGEVKISLKPLSDDLVASKLGTVIRSNRQDFFFIRGH